MKTQKIKILLIDDEEEFISTLAERLELRDYLCKTLLNDGLLHHLNHLGVEVETVVRRATVNCCPCRLFFSILIPAKR